MKGDDMRVNVLGKLLLPLGGYFILSIILVGYIGERAIEKIKQRVFLDANRHLHKIFEEKINEQKAARAIGALTLANDSVIKSALLSRNKKLAYKEIKNLPKVYENYTKFDDIEIILFSKKNGFEFFASTNHKLGKKIKSFLPPLKWIEKHKKLLVTFDLASDGLLLRGISPIIYKNRVIGGVEFNGGLDGAIKDLKKDGIYLITVEKGKSFHAALSKEHYDKDFYEVIKKDFQKLLQSDVSYIDGYFIVKIPIKNFENKIVGEAFIAERNETIEHLVKINEESLIKIMTVLGILAIVLAALFYVVVNKVVINPLTKIKRVLELNSTKEKEDLVDLNSEIEDEFGDITKFVNDNILKRARLNEEIIELMKIIDENVLIVTLDNEGKIIDATTKFCEVTGFSKDELKNLKITDFILSESLKEKILDAIKAKRVIEFEVELKTKDEKRIWLNITLTPHIRDNEEKFVLISFDVTDKKIIEELNEQIHQSIEYALLIQKAILIEEEILRRHFKEAFIIWLPREIVSGDVYFFVEINKDECLIFVVDCTSHGVPGAFVTMVVKAIEREIAAKVKDGDIEASPAKILEYFNKEIKHLFAQFDKTNAPNVNVGFDGGIIYYNKKENIAKYAGAYTSLFLVRDEEVKEIKGDRVSVGYKISEMNYKFNEKEIKLQENDRLYITTDGLLDQLGGPKSLPFGKRRFKEIILLNLPLDEQKELIINELNKYKGDEPQTDDITVVGIKI